MPRTTTIDEFTNEELFTDLYGDPRIGRFTREQVAAEVRRVDELFIRLSTTGVDMAYWAERRRLLVNRALGL